MTRRLLNLLTAVSLLLAPSVVGATFSADAPAAAQAPLAKLPGPSGTDVEFSQDGKYILTAGGDQARVWDAQMFQPVTGPLRHGEGKKLLLAQLNPAGAEVLTVTGPEAYLWDVKATKRVSVLDHGAEIRSAAFSPDGRRIVTGGADNVARVWDFTGKELSALRHAQDVLFCAFSPDGALLLTIEDELSSERLGSRLRVWDLKTDKEVWLTPQEVYLKGPPRQRRRPAGFSPDGTKVAWVAWGSAWVSDARDGGGENWEGSHDFDGWYLDGVAFSPCVDRLMVIKDDVRFLDPTRRDLPGVRTLETDGVWDAVFSPDGRYVLTAARTDRSGVWEVATGRRVLTLPPHVLHDESKRKPWERVLRGNGQPDFAYEVPAIAFSPDGRRILAGYARGGETEVWAVDPPQPNVPKQ